MIEDKANEKLKKRLQDFGLIVNASDNQPKPKVKQETTAKKAVRAKR
jgi:hypothetical protein